MTKIKANDIIHIAEKEFDIENDIAVLCVQDYNNNAQGNTVFKKDNVYSVDFAKSVGCVLNGYTMRCTTKKEYFKFVDKSDIEAPVPAPAPVSEPEIEKAPEKPAKAKKTAQEPAPEII